MMLLVISNSRDATADYLCGRLDEGSVPYLRFNSDANVGDLGISYKASAPALRCGARWWGADQFSQVWYRRPKPLELGLEMEGAELAHTTAEWGEALEGFFAHIPLVSWMNHPSLNACASHKVEQLTRASRFGLAVPTALITQDPEEARQFWADCDGKVVVKPLASGYLERADPSEDTLIYSNRVTTESLDDIGLIPLCPTLFQEEVLKEYDVRICMIDDEVIGAGLKAADRSGQQRLDIRRDNMSDVEYFEVEVPDDVRSPLLGLVRSYGLRFSAIDMAVDRDGHWWFFEINPNGQWAWLDLAGGFDIAGSFVRSFSK